MLSDFMRETLRQEIAEQLTTARRQLREQEQRLARLRFEWNIARRMRSQARTEDEREKWRVQSDAYLNMVLQQENVIQETQTYVEHHQARLVELDTCSTDEAVQQRQ